MTFPAELPKRSLQLLLAIALALFPLTLASAKTAHAQEPKSSSASSQNSAANSPIKRAVESDSIDNDDTTSQASESEAPIVDWTKTGTCRWMIDASGCLTIEPLPGNQSGDLVVFPWQIGLKGDSIRNRISSVTIRGSVHVSNEDSLHRISTGGMFAKCENLKTADLSGLDTSDAVYMWGMFSDCPSLKSLNLSSLDTSSAENMETMFWGCSSLESVDLSGWDVSKVESMGSMFEDCSSLKSVDLSGWNMPRSTRSLFWGCSSLESVDLSGWDTSSLTDTSYMFDFCSSLKTIDLSEWDTSSLARTNSMFSSCTSLKTIDLSGWDTSSLTDTSDMFCRCSSLESLDLSKWDTSNINSTMLMFEDCSSLKTLDLSGWDTSNTEFMTETFTGCSSLRSITLGDKFSFNGRKSSRQCSLPTPKGEGTTGLWVSSTDGIAYAPDNVPNNVAAIYTAVPFPDVDYSSWYAKGVSYCAAKGLITGYTDGDKAGLFGVSDTLTRAQLATILWRNACPDEYASYDPEAAKDTTGIDGSADGMYYTAAANWAVKNGVITGFDREDGSKDFAADENVSFEQLVTILARLCATPEELSAAGSDLSAFADGDLASSWSRGAFAWAAAKGLVQGYDEPTGKYLRPGEPVARERAAVVLMRAFEMDILK